MDRWPHQEAAFQFAINKPAVMLDMDMGTGKTKVALDLIMSRQDVQRVLIVCPCTILVDGVWPKEIIKFGYDDSTSIINFGVPAARRMNVQNKSIQLWEAIQTASLWMDKRKIIVVVNYEIIWRKPLSDTLRKCNFDMVVLDESHRAKGAGSKTSKFAALLGKDSAYHICLSGTFMSHGPLDVYGQFRFLDPSIFGTRYDNFEQKYAILGGPDRKFVTGYKNLEELHNKFKPVTFSIKMADIKDQLQLPDLLPPIERHCELNPTSYKATSILIKEFITECNGAYLVVDNILHMTLRQKQMSSGFAMVVDNPLDEPRIEEMNTSKEDLLYDTLLDIPPNAHVVVFCEFKHDLEAVERAARKDKRNTFELSGKYNQLDEWRKQGGVIAIQVQAGAEGIDLTISHTAFFYSLPTLTQYEQAKARLYRPGQKTPVAFIHLIATNTIDEILYRGLQIRKDIIDMVRDGDIDVAYLNRVSKT